MLRFLPLLLFVGFQEAELDQLVLRLETADSIQRLAIIETLIAKGDPAQAAVLRRIDSAPEEKRDLLKSVHHRLDLQRKLRKACPVPAPIDFEAVDRPIKELIPDVERWLGRPIDPKGVPDRKVTLRIKKASPLEALDAFHEATGLGWTLSEDRTFDSARSLHISVVPKALLVARRRSTWPACSSGRYRISATSVVMEQNSGSKEPAATGSIELLIEYPHDARPQNLATFAVARIVDDQGRELSLIPNPAASRVGFPQIGPGAAPLALGRTIRFKQPAGDARSISILGGKGRAEFIADRTYLTFEDPLKKVGTTLESDGLKVTLNEFQPAHGWMRLVLDQSGRLDIAKLRVEPFEYRGSSLVEFIEVVHQDGQITYPSTQGAQQEGAVHRKRTMCFGTPEVKAIRLAVRTFVAYEDFTFELRDIPLPGVK